MMLEIGLKSGRRRTKETYIGWAKGLIGYCPSLL